jgi:glutathione S-transferase
MKVKSRPAFRPILLDRWPGLAPASHYDDLDF